MRRLALTVILLAGVASCGDDDSPAGAATTTTVATTNTATATTTTVAPVESGFRTITETFVDESRLTRDEPRTLVTTIRIPNDGTGEPHPLVVFAHGLGSDLSEYTDLLDAWAMAGYVVAAPLFPYTNADAPGGPEATDYVNQPADLSFIIDNLTDTTVTDREWSDLIDPDAVAVAGHSNGGITAYGTAANTCCHDPRVRAVVILAGNPQAFGDAPYDYGSNPPVLVVHGTADAQMAYNPSVEAFNEMRLPKAFVSFTDGQHGEWLRDDDANFTTTVGVTLAFLDAVLGGTGLAADTFDGIASDGAVITVVAGTTDTETVSTLPQPEVNRVASVTPNTGLTAGQQVTVEWSGYLPGQSVNVLQCAEGALDDAAVCDLQRAQLLLPNPTGSGSVTFTILDGPVGVGLCDVDHNTCVIRVNDSGLLDPEATLALPISFGG